jgi:uncharacterized OB-fold protein
MTTKPIPSITPLTEPYWDGCAHEELRIQRCGSCGAAVFFPRQWCPACWTTDLNWERASGRGSIVACSVVSQAPYASYAGDPYVVAIVRLEEGPHLMCNIVGCPPGTVMVGDPVQVTFEGRGDVTVPQFRPCR